MVITVLGAHHLWVFLTHFATVFLFETKKHKSISGLVLNPLVIILLPIHWIFQRNITMQHQLGKCPFGIHSPLHCIHIPTVHFMTVYKTCNPKPKIIMFSRFSGRPSAHYNDVLMGTMASQITSLTIVYSIIYLGVDQRKHQSSASLAFVWGIHRWPVNSPHKWPVTRKMFPFDDVIMRHVL